MDDWREIILREFTPGIAKLTLVADPDGLLIETEMLARLRERGFDLLPFDDSIAFRYAYEAKYRAEWDRGESTDLVVVLRHSAGELNGLPYDLLQAGRKLAFSLNAIFPNLDYRVVNALDRGDLDALFRAQRRNAPEVLGENASKDFVLRHVFELAPELLKNEVGLLRVLLQRHYSGRIPPAILDDRLIRLLHQDKTFAEWPLEILLRDRDAFFTFLQERWPIFLDQGTNGDHDHMDGVDASLAPAVSGPLQLPFDHQDIRVYVDNLFVEGLLRPVRYDDVDRLPEPWARIGIIASPAEDNRRRASKLMVSLRQNLPVPDARHGDWLHYARTWAELSLLRHRSSEAHENDEFIDLQHTVDTAFSVWLEKRYAGLVNLASLTPIMLHHLNRHLAQTIVGEHRGKVALVVVDGLSLEQWLIVRDALSESRPRLRFHENALFAWIPTLTSVSRQALFAGNPPLRFPNSFLTTEREPNLWMQFWSEQGLTSQEIVYQKGLGDGGIGTLEEILSHPKARVAGLVVDMVDRIMHGMRMGAPGMINQVGQWASQSWLPAFIDMLLEKGFQIHLTSDHGNVEAQGCGRASEGNTADVRGDRVRLYSDPVLRQQVKARFSAATEWEPIGLPPGRFPLLAPPRLAFALEKERVVSHGGNAIEEVIVPWVRIESVSS